MKTNRELTLATELAGWIRGMAMLLEDEDSLTDEFVIKVLKAKTQKGFQTLYKLGIIKNYGDVWKFKPRRKRYRLRAGMQPWGL